MIIYPVLLVYLIIELLQEKQLEKGRNLLYSPYLSELVKTNTQIYLRGVPYKCVNLKS